MSKVRYQPLGPLLSGKGSRAVLGLQIPESAPLEARPVVLVWLPDEDLRDVELISAVEKETARAMLLEHPNIIRVHGFTTHPEGRARVVEFADGESLRRILEVSKKLPPPLAALIAADAATGLHYAHLAGNDDGTPLVHADLRPETLLVTYGGVTKVAGYGALSFAPKEPGGRRVRGRRHHCAPEQVLGGRSAVNVQTDVYLLGVALCECITGQVPFEGELDFDQAVLTTPPPELPPSLCPPALAAVIRKAMAKKATERYPNVLALREAIEQAMAPLPSHDALADFLRGPFPETDAGRTARRELLTVGLAKLAEEVAAMPPPPRPAPAPALAKVGAETPLAAPPPQRRSSLLPVVAGVVALIGTAAVWTLRKDPGALPPGLAAALDAGADDAGDEGALAVVDAGADDAGALAAVELDGGAADDGDGGVLASSGTGTGTVGSGSGATDGGEPMLALTVEPNVDVEIDGKPAGRTPLTVPLAPGRHLLRLTDRAKVINLVRSVTVPESGTATQRIYLNRGFINVTAPEGSEIFIDGRSYGKAPQREIGVYEGSHRLVVMVGEAKWQETFETKPNERLKFNVAFE